MDVDSESDHRTSPLIAYFDGSTNFPWRQPRFQQIEERRALLGDLLIFDILLSAGGIRDFDTLYPPRDEEGLQRLLGAIETSIYDALKKNCLVYFLLKFYQDGREDKFEEQQSIPPQFTALSDAYWYLDTGINIQRAVSILCDARLNRDYASKILQAISLSPNPAPLVRKYIRTAQPTLTEPDDLDLYTISLAESNLHEAWQFQRTFIETGETRPRLFKKMLEWCLIPSPKQRPLSQLLTLPLSSYEQSILHEYALRPPNQLPASSIAVLQNLVCVRLLKVGKYADAIKMDREFASLDSTRGLRQAQDRVKMIQDLYGALPSIERSLLDAELAKPVEVKPAAAAGPSKVISNGADTSLSQSWEDVRMPEATTSKAKTGMSVPMPSTPIREPPNPMALPVSERAGPLRFGGSTPASSGNTLSSRSPFLPGFHSVSNPRQSFPLSTIPLSESTLRSSKPRSSFGGTAARMMLTSSPGVSSLSSGMKFPHPTPPRASTSVHALQAAKTHANAFYQPLEKSKGAKHPFIDEEADTHTPVPVSAEVDIDVPMDSSDDTPQLNTNAINHDEEAGLSFSVFGNESAAAKGKEAKQPKARKSLPGAFITDDEDAMAEDDEEEEQPAPTPHIATRSRLKTSRQTTATKPATRTTSKRDFEEDEENEEHDDNIAPLPPSPPKRPARKARSSVSSEPGEDTKGIKTRRSSRISHTNATAEQTAPVAKTKKSTRSVAGKKKR